MGQTLASSIGNIAARSLRAVCILSATGLIVSAWAVADVPAENSAPQPTTTIATTSKKAAPPSKPSAKTALTKPSWSELTPAQQQALAPLSTDWNRLDSLRKQKWLALANKFPGMNPEEQQRVQNRMRDWAKLTPAQRRAVRESYARTKKLNADQKTEKWQQYQNLPDEEKKKLAAEVENKKRLANLPHQGANKNKPRASVKSVSKPTLAKPALEPQPVPTTPQPDTLQNSPALTPAPTK